MLFHVGLRVERSVTHQASQHLDRTNKTKISTEKCTRYLRSEISAAETTHQIRLGGRRRRRPRGIMGVPQVVYELDFRLEKRPRRARAVVAPEHPALAAVVHAEVHLQRGLGREHLLAQHAPVEVLRVRLHQVFLHVLGRGERRGTLLARVLRGGHQEVSDHVVLVVLEVRERQVTVRTGQLDLGAAAAAAVAVVGQEGRSGGGGDLQLRLLAFVRRAAVDPFLFRGARPVGAG